MYKLMQILQFMQSLIAQCRERGLLGTGMVDFTHQKIALEVALQYQLCPLPLSNKNYICDQNVTHIIK